VAGSVEERMLALQAKKRKLADAILQGNVDSSTFTESELDTLFAPLSR
jgi:SNF2 family DNA or RNA helicase